MTDYDRDRLEMYIADVGMCLRIVQGILKQPENPQQEVAASMTRAAIELVAGIRQQMEIAGGN